MEILDVTIRQAISYIQLESMHNCRYFWENNHYKFIWIEQLIIFKLYCLACLLTQVSAHVGQSVLKNLGKKVNSLHESIEQTLEKKLDKPHPTQDLGLYKAEIKQVERLIQM